MHALPLCASVHHTPAQCPQRSRASDSLELELQAVVSYYKDPEDKREQTSSTAEPSITPAQLQMFLMDSSYTNNLVPEAQLGPIIKQK